MLMNDVRIITGNEAAALAVKLARPGVIAAYPITPQTSLAEKLSEYVERGEAEGGICQGGKRALLSDRLHIGIDGGCQGVYGDQL